MERVKSVRRTNEEPYSTWEMQSTDGHYLEDMEGPELLNLILLPSDVHNILSPKSLPTPFPVTTPLTAFPLSTTATRCRT